MRRFLIASLAALAAALMTAAAPAMAGERVAADCENPAMLAKIKSRFHHQTRNVPHLPDVQIEAFSRIHQHRYLPARDDRPIARRYCGAKAELSDGRSRYVWFLIENPMGFAGVGNNVEFCVSGFDRWFVYNGRCRVLR